MSRKLAETPERIYEGGQREGMESLLAEELGEKYIEYRKKWVKASSRELVTEFPLYIQIEHVAHCNLRCPICIQGIDKLREDYTKNINPITLEAYKKILEEIKEYDCPSMAFHNNDEPLLLSDLEERIRMAKDAGVIDLIIATNATFLTEARAKKLIDSGLTKINFSVGSYKEELYNKVRPPGNFNEVVKNIETFVKIKNSTSRKLPITRVSCVMTKYTDTNFDEFRKFWENIGVDIIERQNFQALKGYTEKLRPANSKVDTAFTCNAPWQQVVIRPNGDVLPCCSFYGTELIIGNINNQSIHEIWNGAKMKRIREELKKDNFSFLPACSKCAGTFYTL